ncbi:unnamed protein product, partial [Allacma fusca]
MSEGGGCEDKEDISVLEAEKEQNLDKQDA